MATSNGEPTASSNTGLAHVAISNGKVRIDVASGEFAAVLGSGDFMIYRDTAHAVTIYKPAMMQDFQLDLQKLNAGLTKTVNGFGAALGVKATNVKLDFASLGAGDNVGPLATVKYRLTQDYTLTMSFLGMPGQSTKMHSTTDYWYTPSLTMMVNPFAQTIQETAWLGAEYGKQLSALQAKLPKGIPVKQVMTDVATDSAGTKTTTTVTWSLSGFVRAAIPRRRVSTSYRLYAGPGRPGSGVADADALWSHEPRRADGDQWQPGCAVQQGTRRRATPGTAPRPVRRRVARQAERRARGTAPRLRVRPVGRQVAHLRLGMRQWIPPPKD